MKYTGWCENDLNVQGFCVGLGGGEEGVEGQLAEARRWAGRERAAGVQQHDRPVEAVIFVVQRERRHVRVPDEADVSREPVLVVRPRLQKRAVEGRHARVDVRQHVA